MEATGSACSSCYVNTFLCHRRRQPKCGSIANEAAIVILYEVFFSNFPSTWHRTHFTWSSSRGSRGCVYAVDEGPYYTEKSTFALNGLREKTEVILAAAPRGCVSGSSVRRARPRVRPSRSAFQPLCRRGNFVSQCIECRAAPPPPPAHVQG